MAGRRGASDERGRLQDDPFAWRATAAGQLLVSRGGRHVVTVGGADAARLLARLEDAEAKDDELAVQHLLARATGNYRRGTERRAGR
ncbi:hypothetical protein ROT00_10765 [Agromyces mediolanus]|uniref:hypothetical protein n=1 Tax=Agromyces mediolanus TaxID=41986 RepID=UPI0038366ACF